MVLGLERNMMTLAEIIVSKMPNFIDHIIEELNTTESNRMACQAMFACLCFINPTLKGVLHQKMCNLDQE